MLFTALLAPYFVDWTAFRAQFEEEAGKVIGQPVKVGGTASLRILPLPTVTFTEISVGEYQDGAPVMSIERFSLDAELMPFLSGEVRIVDMRLERPVALIRLRPDGSIDWPSPPATLVDPGKVQLEALTVSNGALAIEGLEGGRRISVEGINASLAAQSLIGPWRIEAKGDVDGVAATISAVTGKVQDDGSFRLAVEGRRLDQPYRMKGDGNVTFSQDHRANWRGRFELLPALMADGKPVPDALPVAARGEFSATSSLVEIADYALDIGSSDDPYTITGKGALQLSDPVSFRFEADGRQVDAMALDGRKDGAPPSLPERLAAVRAIVDRIPIPPADGVIDFELPAIVSGDTVIREVSAAFRPDGSVWQVERLSATLPGNTALEARGRLGVADDFGFTGKMTVASRQPTGLGAWLSGGNDPALRRLKSAGFTADVTLTPNQASLEELELSLDGVSITGSMQRLQPGDGKPALVANLSGAAIDLDDLRALQALAGGGTGLASHDFDLALKAAELRGDGLVARDVDAHLRIADGALSVDRLISSDFYGAKIESSGAIFDLLGVANGSFSVKVEARDACQLVNLLAERAGTNPVLDAFIANPVLCAGLSAQASIEARPQDNGTRATILANGEIGGTKFDVSERFEGRLESVTAGRHDLVVKLANSEAQHLASQLAIPVLPLDSGLDLTLDLEISGKADEALSGIVALRGPQSEVSASLAGRFETAVAGSAPDFGKPDLTLQLSAGVGDLDPWAMMAGIPMPGLGGGTPVSLKGELKLQGDTATLSNMTGSWAGNAYSGRLMLARPPSQPVRITGELATQWLSLPLLAELAAGSAAFSPEGGQFGAPPFGDTQLDVLLKAKTVETGFSPDAADFSGKANYAGGALSISGMEANWLGGRHFGEWVLRNNGSGTVTASLSGKLAAMDAATALSASGHAPLFKGKVDLTYSLSAEGRSAGALLASLGGSGAFTYTGGAISGLTINGLAAIIASADGEGFEVKPETVTPLVEANVLTGEALVSAFSGTFSVKDGEVTARNLAAEGGGAQFRAEGQMQLAAGESRLVLGVNLPAGEYALAGTEPGVVLEFAGPAGAMTRKMDTSALENFLSLRAFEREQRRVELLQASVLEKLRLRREVIASNARIAMRERKRQEEIERLEALQREMEAQRAEEERKRAEEEAANRAAQEERAKAEAAAATPKQTPEATLPNLKPSDTVEPVDLLEKVNKLLAQ